MEYNNDFLYSSFKDIHLPRWDELPDIHLYADQVVDYIEKNIGFMFVKGTKFITTSMIHNYAKLNLMPKPEKKRYEKKHIAFLIAITILKQVMNIADIKKAIIMQIEILGNSHSYNKFCEELEFSFKFLIEGIENNSLPERKLEDDTIVLSLASQSIANKVLLAMQLSVYNVNLKD